MKNYYIEVNGQHSEPLTFEELKTRSLTLDTLIWFEGMEEWTKAGNIPELAGLFRNIPPPIQKTATTPPPPPPPPTPATPPVYHTPLQSSPSGIFKKALIGGFMIVVLVVLVFSFADDTQSKVQTQTEENTQQLEQQQQLIDEQNAKIAEQERLEKERQERERKANIEAQIKDISSQLNTAYNNVTKARQQVNDATAFQLLRSRSERNDQINEATEVLTSWEAEVKRLEGELQRLNAEL